MRSPAGLAPWRLGAGVVLMCGLGMVPAARPQPASAQPGPPPLVMPPARLAVEIPRRSGPPEYVLLSSRVAGYRLIDDERLRPIQGAAPQTAPARGLDLEFKVAGDTVTIEATAYFGTFDHTGSREGLSKIPHQSLGTFAGGIGESVTLAPMAEYGLEPLTLKIVSGRLDPSAWPQAISEAPAIEIKIAAANRIFYTVEVRNRAAQAVTAFLLSCGGASLDQEGGPEAIAPGSARVVTFNVPHGGNVTNGVFVPNPAPEFLTLEGAFFADGSYQGGVDAAAKMRASRIGQDGQRQRIALAIAPILAASGSGDDANLARVRAAASQLSEEPDQALLERVRSQFPGLSADAAEQVKNQLAQGLYTEKQEFDSHLNDFRSARTEPGPGDLASWCQEWLQGPAR